MLKRYILSTGTVAAIFQQLLDSYNDNSGPQQQPHDNKVVSTVVHSITASTKERERREGNLSYCMHPPSLEINWCPVHYRGQLCSIVMITTRLDK